MRAFRTLSLYTYFIVGDEFQSLSKSLYLKAIDPCLMTEDGEWPTHQAIKEFLTPRMVSELIICCTVVHGVLSLVSVSIDCGLGGIVGLSYKRDWVRGQEVKREI